MVKKKEPEYITLTEAAERAGYRSTAGLRRAANEGRLRAVRFGPRAWMTTEAWVDEYIANRRPWGKERGSTEEHPTYRRKDTDRGQ